MFFCVIIFLLAEKRSTRVRYTVRKQNLIKSETRLALLNPEPAVFEAERHYCSLLNREFSFEKFKSGIIACIMELGFSDVSFVRLLKRDETEIHLKTFPNVIADFYTKENIWGHDLALDYASTEGAVDFFQTKIDGWIAASPFSTTGFRKNKVLQTFIKGLGFLEHYNIPMPAVNGHGHVLFTVSTKDMPAAALQTLALQHRNALIGLASSIDIVGTKKHPKNFLSRVEILNGEHAQGYALLQSITEDNQTVQEAADTHHMHLRTATRHLENIRKYLGARTLTKAVAIAFSLGYLPRKVKD